MVSIVNFIIMTFALSLVYRVVESNGGCLFNHTKYSYMTDIVLRLNELERKVDSIWSNLEMRSIATSGYNLKHSSYTIESLKRRLDRLEAKKG